jgi:hypothetical protein
MSLTLLEERVGVQDGKPAPGQADAAQIIHVVPHEDHVRRQVEPFREDSLELGGLVRHTLETLHLELRAASRHDGVLLGRDHEDGEAGAHEERCPHSVAAGAGDHFPAAREGRPRTRAT